MKNLNLFFIMLFTICFLQITFAQEEASVNQKIEPSIEVVDCYKCNDIAVSLPNPEYPKTIGYGAHKYSGKVSVQILINEKGNVESAKAISGHPFFRPIVEKAALEAKFKPTVISGEPKKVKGVIIYQINPARIKPLVLSHCHDCKIISQPKPEYPEAAKYMNVSGEVSVQVLVDEKGNVESIGDVTGHPLLRSEAVKAALKAKFAPVTLSGKLVKFYTTLVYNFVADEVNQ